MNDLDRDASISELLMRSGVYQSLRLRPPKDIREGFNHLNRYLSLLRIDIGNADNENACKGILKVAGACENFLRVFADDNMLYRMLIDSELPEEVPSDL